MKRLDALLRLGRTSVLLLSGLLGLALVAVTFNTIRLQILTQRDEIELCRLIGATHAYIRRPFFYLGSLLGFPGGLAALGIVVAGLAFLNRDLVGIRPTLRIRPAAGFALPSGDGGRAGGCAALGLARRVFISE